MDFIKKALSDNGEPSSKRIMAVSSGLFFVLVMTFVLGYFVRVGEAQSAIERNLITILTAAGSLPAVLQGLTLFQKNENKEGV